MTQSTVPPLKVGLVGFGYASATFHAPLIAATPGLQLAAVSSSAPGRVHAAFPDAMLYATPEALYACDDIDLVVIATPNDTHFPLARAALEAGKHVVVDKPFVLDTSQARELIALADARSLRLSAFHNRRWDGDFMTLSQLLAEGTLGRIVHVESHFDRYRPQVQARWRESGAAGGGLWYDLGPHLVDQAVQLFGPPATIWLDMEQQRDGALTDDWFHAVLGYGTMRVVLHASALTAIPAPRFTVHGTQGSYVKHGLDMQETALRAGAALADGWSADTSDGVLALHTAQGVVEQAHATLPGAYTQYYAQMRDAILHGAPVPVTAESAHDVLALIEAGIASAREARVVQLRGQV
ncbi:oxidoreductase [Massilia yuzhufengensis]|uniref:Scyllo-inositol 2-dehydrogenase (NADP+) n=1 Tax=Massilia yuzhufengensis TaxID=1164594 RepID=A0A1I1WP43_9BURK|nr:oxidoreductase [Massilia yuzhufengensis]SFD96896.1 scyllo-inositol 2-dehydrogenase (NADP+) [Massilia yuzhufengensis]